MPAEKAREEGLKIGKLSETEKWMKDNPLILNGYRMNCCSCRLSVGSICAWHNETINIWTHLIGFVVVVGLFILNLIRDHPVGYSIDIPEQKTSKLPFHVFLLTAITCLGCSTVLHVFAHQSEKILRFVLKLDLVGICALSYGGGVGFFYYALDCKKFQQAAFFIIFTSIVLVTCYIALTMNIFNPQRSRNLVTLFGIMVSFMFFSAFYVRYCHDYPEGYSPEIPFYYGIGSVLTYFAGSIVYASRFPEKYFPGKFDIVGASHQIWHLFVLAGVYLDYQMSVENYQERQKFDQCVTLGLN